MLKFGTFIVHALIPLKMYLFEAAKLGTLHFPFWDATKIRNECLVIIFASCTTRISEQVQLSDYIENEGGDEDHVVQIQQVTICNQRNVVNLVVYLSSVLLKVD